MQKNIIDMLTAINENKRRGDIAHMLEDDLFHEFIMYVAQRKSKLGEEARLVLESRNIKFNRYCK